MGLFNIFKNKKPKSAWDELMENPDIKLMVEVNDGMRKQNTIDGCTEDELPEGIGEFGLVPTNPIPTNSVMGSNLYLGGLRTYDNERVDNIRLGSMVAGNIKHPIDKYSITNQNGDEIAIIYLSPYQARNSRKAPNGLKQVSPLL
ncbi:MAG: hypothetical protein KGZ62_05090 [Sulfurimonas sp.]|nr:hypothetical protein [Sulfurimonas sp.]